MSLPWVSRLAFEAVVNHAASLIKENDRLSVRFDSLLEKYHALKLQGAEAPPPIVPVQVAAPRDEAFWGVDEMKTLIAEQAGTDLRRRAIMLRQLKQDRADGVSPEEIRRSIENGVQSDGIPA
jgi:hypothetical protein